jgi:hypothetical protein
VRSKGKDAGSANTRMILDKEKNSVPLERPAQMLITHSKKMTAGAYFFIC